MFTTFCFHPLKVFRAFLLLPASVFPLKHLVLGSQQQVVQNKLYRTTILLTSQVMWLWCDIESRFTFSPQTYCFFLLLLLLFGNPCHHHHLHMLPSLTMNRRTGIFGLNETFQVKLFFIKAPWEYGILYLHTLISDKRNISTIIISRSLCLKWKLVYFHSKGLIFNHFVFDKIHLCLITVLLFLNLVSISLLGASLCLLTPLLSGHLSSFTSLSPHPSLQPSHTQTGA